ncbi:MAG: hypothetical protein IAF02_06735 [Anaerolineae bacterium]|nr:hypothetical protein [Anaerolineae bacterium]
MTENHATTNQTQSAKLSQLKNWRWLPLVEILIIMLWGIWVGRAYLNMDPMQWPIGREIGMVIQPHYIWTLLLDCGTCIFWDGYANGGIPAFSELQAPMLHPLMVIPTILLGVINGTKILLIGSLIMAGLAQWWLARVMRLGFVARVWSGLIIISAGHLAGRMELGVVGVVLSTAACSLVLAPALQLAINGRRRDAIILSIVLALAIVSGQGYMQLGLLVAIFPAFIIYLFDDDLKIRPVWKEFLLAGFLAILLAGIFLVPMLHFWPHFGKALEPNLSWVQPLEYIPLNFIIRDVDFYYVPYLDKLPYPYMHINYTGWIPILLAALPLYFVRRGQRKLLFFLGVSLFLTLLAASGLTFKLLNEVWPEFVSGIRIIPLTAGLSVPIIMALAAWGLDELLKTNWPVIVFASPDTLAHPRIVLKLSTLLVLVLLLASIKTTYDFTQQWLRTEPIHTESIEVMDAAVTDSSQWVATPFGEHFWGPLAAERGIKLSPFVRPFHWKDRDLPVANLQMDYTFSAPDQPDVYASLHGITIREQPEHQYAYMLTDSGSVSCDADARGGLIRVNCDSDQSGILMVEEFSWTGWQVTQDGFRTALLPNEFLSTLAPEGEHTFVFRYLPLDVALGLCLTLIGIVLAAWLWLRTTSYPAKNKGFTPENLEEAHTMKP